MAGRRLRLRHIRARTVRQIGCGRKPNEGKHSMQPTRWITALLIPGLILTGTPGLAPAQEIEPRLNPAIESGTRIPVDRFGEFLVRSVMIGETEKNLAIGETEKNLEIGETEKNVLRRDADPRTGWPVALRIELVSREGGMLGGFDSEAIRMEPGKTYDISAWISGSDALDDVLIAPLEPAEFVIFRIGQKTITGTRSMPKECGDATHAVLVAPRNADSRSDGQALALCFDATR